MFTFFAIFKVFDITNFIDSQFLWFYELFSRWVVENMERPAP